MTGEPPPGPNLAAMALILGVMSLLLLCWYVLSIPTGIAALACGWTARRRGTDSGIARAGMFCGSVTLLLSAFIIILPG